MIEIKNLTKAYAAAAGAPHALDDVSLTIADGDITGIIGMSGAGKSTLGALHQPARAAPPPGSIIVDGQDVTGLSGAALRSYRRRVAMIFQNFGLLAQKTVLANVCFPLQGGHRAQSPPANRERALELLDMVGLREKAQAYPAQLSGGQQQRVAIARALACEPEYILCDEATSALDPASTNTILKLLREINRETGVTVIVITHSMSVVEKICQQRGRAWSTAAWSSRGAWSGRVRRPPARNAAQVLLERVDWDA